MSNRYIILKFGTRRVLLHSEDGKSATMTQHVNGDWITFDYSACAVIGSMTVEDEQDEPTPYDIVNAIGKFQEDCDQKTRNALIGAGCVRVDGNTSL